MSLSNLKTNPAVKNIDSDFVGGSRVLDADTYLLEIKLAYLTTAKSGAMALNIEAVTDTGAKVNETVYMTSGTAKGGKNTYTDKNGEEKYLPGFITANTLALLTVGKEIGDVDVEEKVINLYSYELKKEAPTKVQMFTELLGTKVIAGIEKQIVDKRAKNEAGAYVATGETREQNEIAKFFRERDKMTVTEIQAQAEEAAFIHVWEEANKGNVKDKSTKTGVSSGAPAKSGAATPAASGGVKSLFA